MFSERENIALQNTPDALKPLVFFHIWSQKEALIKACGLGLSYPTQQFDVPTAPPTNQSIYDSHHNQTWQMVSFFRALQVRKYCLQHIIPWQLPG